VTESAVRLHTFGFATSAFRMRLVKSAPLAGLEPDACSLSACDGKIH
jgi:hypothetical protein